MKTKHILSILALSIGLVIGMSCISTVMAECFNQPNFNIKGYCRSDNNDGYYIKAGIGIPIARSGFQCKFIQINNTDMGNILFVPLGPGSTGNDEFSSLLNAVESNSSISALVSLSNCLATCDSNNNLIVTVGGSVFTYPCGDYSECINDAEGNGQCTPVSCSNITSGASGYYHNSSDTTPLLWCPHLPLSREDKANGLDVPQSTNQACPLSPVPTAPCYFSTCGNGQLDGTEDCDTLVDTSGRCAGCDCGNFVNGSGGMCTANCIITPTCTGDTPFLVNCGCSLCPADEQLMWPEKLECKLGSTKSMVNGINATSTTTYYELPRICKTCGTPESNGTYTPKITLRTHGYYRNNYSTNRPYDRTLSTVCSDFDAAGSNVICRKTVASSIMNLTNNQGVNCPAGTYNDTNLNELKRGILSCNVCSGIINSQYSAKPTGSHNGTPFYYDGTCHLCEKGLAATNYGNATWYYCRDRYGIADLNHDGDLNDPGENLVQYQNNTGSDPEAPYYRRSSVSSTTGCDNNNDGLLDTDKAFHRWGTMHNCVPYTFCNDAPTATIYPACSLITDPPTMAALQTQKPSCPADLVTPAPTTEGTQTVCTPCPAPYKHVNVYIKLVHDSGAVQYLDYRTRVNNALASKYTCHSTCSHNAPFYYDDGLGGGLTCHSCPTGYLQIQNYWSGDYYSQYIECSKIACPLTTLIYDDTNDGTVNPTCHNCPQGTFELANTTNWPLAGSKCWPSTAYCNNTNYPGTATKYPTGLFFRHVTQSTTYYNATTGALSKRDDTTNISPPFYTDNSIYTTDPAVCGCPAGTRYQDNTNNGATVPDYSYYYVTNSNLYRPTVYCVDCPAGSNFFYQGTGDTSPVCHTCQKTYYYQAAGETVPSCHACEASYFYQGTGDPAPTCHVCPQSQPLCPAAFNCALPQYSCNIYGDPEFDPDTWDHMPNCDCRCKLTTASCTGAKPYLNPVLCKCQATSLTAYCGNGAMDPGEECDTVEDGDSYEDSNGVPHINRCIACQIHRVTACDSRAYTTWVNGAYTERPIAGQCPAALTPATNNGAGLTMYNCTYWEPKHINTVIDPLPVHQSEATASSGCIFECQTGLTYNPVTKTCGI